MDAITVRATMANRCCWRRLRDSQSRAARRAAAKALADGEPYADYCPSSTVLVCTGLYEPERELAPSCACTDSLSRAVTR